MKQRPRIYYSSEQKNLMKSSLPVKEDVAPTVNLVNRYLSVFSSALARDGRDRVCLCAVRSIGRQSPPPPRSHPQDSLAGSPECCCCLQTRSHSDASWSLQPQAEDLIAERIQFRRIVALLKFLRSLMPTIELVGLQCLEMSALGCDINRPNRCR